MHRRTLLAGLLALLAAGPAFARAELVDDIVRQLEKRGYTSITVSDTWLGRVRILAEGPKGSREIILNPATGEILRDLKRSKGKGGSDLLDDEDEDEDSDTDDSDDDSDNSGSGKSGDDDSGDDDSGNSGSDDSGSDDGGSDDGGSDDSGGDDD